MTRDRAAATIGGAALALAVGVPFFAATTFTGDDHLFLAFARHVRDPLAAFVRDLHGGEYYRPLWMSFWWVLGQGGHVWPFQLAALALHAAAALLVAVFLRALGRPPVVARVAAGLMFLAPQNLAAAYWFSATTDLLATVFVLLALVALVRGRFGAAAIAALAAGLCKESSYVLPGLSLLALGVARRAGPDHSVPARGAVVRGVIPQVVLLAGVALARRMVLGGWGGGGEGAHAGLAGLALQIFAGCAQTFTGELFPLPAALALGSAALALSALALARQPRGAARFAPLAFAAIAVLPLAAAGWAVGARYFYLPAIGICWAAAEALAPAGSAARVTVAVVLLVVGLAQSGARRQEAVAYDRRVAAARRAVAAGLAEGHRVFHVDGGIKDLDLAVKEDPRLEAAGVLVLDDVPASFAIIPPAFEQAARPLLARPPLPPSGGYHFGDATVVGLARRGDEPDLEEALAMFPDLRFIRLHPVPGGQVVARDLTSQIKQRLDGDPADGQD